MITVLHILYELRSSGAEVRIKNAAPNWKEKGIVLHVLSTSKVKGDFADKLESAGMIIHHIPYRNSLKFYFELIKFYRSIKCDVVQIHVEHTALTYALLAWIAKVPVIIRAITTPFLFEGKVKFNRGVRRWIMRRIGVVQVSVSEAVQQNEINRFKNPTQLINNWYDDQYFVPPTPQERTEVRNSFALTEKDRVILSVGNCAPVKNHDSLIRALRLIPGSQFNLKYWHIGEEEDEKKEQKLVSELGLNGTVQFWGKQNDVRPFLWAADVFIMPSFHEGLSIAMLEAFGSGIQAVLAHSPGLENWNEYIPEIIYTDTTPIDIAHGLSQAISGKTPQERIHHPIFESMFGTKRAADEYYALYEKNLR